MKSFVSDGNVCGDGFVYCATIRCGFSVFFNNKFIPLKPKPLFLESLMRVVILFLIGMNARKGNRRETNTYSE